MKRNVLDMFSEMKPPINQSINQSILSSGPQGRQRAKEEERQTQFCLFEWEFYAQSASKAILRARTYDCIDKQRGRETERARERVTDTELQMDRDQKQNRNRLATVSVLYSKPDC